MGISPAQVKELRERTGIGMMECKVALEETNGDMDAAIKVLRERGQVKQAKRADRVAAEGRVATAVSADGRTGVILQLNSETDFVSRNEEFISVAGDIAAKGLAAGAKSAEAVGSVGLSNGHTVAQTIDDLRAKIGEKIELPQYDVLEGDAVAGYVHFSGKSGALIAAKAPGLDAGKLPAVQEILRDICMHIVANRPLFLDSSQVDEKTANEERAIYTTQARAEGKPENIIPKIIEGKMRAFYKQSCLVDQQFAKNPEITVSQVVKDLSKQVGTQVALTAFVRSEIGEKG